MGGAAHTPTALPTFPLSMSQWHTTLHTPRRVARACTCLATSRAHPRSVPQEWVRAAQSRQARAAATIQRYWTEFMRTVEERRAREKKLVAAMREKEHEVEEGVCERGGGEAIFSLRCWPWLALNPAVNF